MKLGGDSTVELSKEESDEFRQTNVDFVKHIKIHERPKTSYPVADYFTKEHPAGMRSNSGVAKSLNKLRKLAMQKALAKM